MGPTVTGSRAGGLSGQRRAIRRTWGRVSPGAFAATYHLLSVIQREPLLAPTSQAGGFGPRLASYKASNLEVELQTNRDDPTLRLAGEKPDRAGTSHQRIIA
jgi:hypothetical protein